MTEQLNRIIDSLRDEMIDTLKKWIMTPSVKADPQPNAPFGADVRKMLDLALEDCERLGFKAEEFDGYIAHADLGEGSDEDALGILAHLDVVPEGDGWNYPPFGAVIENGRMYGRGTNDDKGPAVAALYAMKAVQMAGIPLKRKVRLILGCDEESGWEDIAHYRKVATMPRIGFSPDACYPVINIEKGLCHLSLKAPAAREGLKIYEFNTGLRPNVVPGKATALIEGNEEMQYLCPIWCCPYAVGASSSRTSHSAADRDQKHARLRSGCRNYWSDSDNSIMGKFHQPHPQQYRLEQHILKGSYESRTRAV